MKHTTVIRSPAAIALGLFFAGVTGAVLFSDVLSGAQITTVHLMALAALVAAIAAGHMAAPAIRSGAIVPGIMLIVLFLGSTGYVVVSSGARNAEQAGNKAAAIEAANGIREREFTQLAKAEAMLAEAQRQLSRECASGKGTRCRGVKETVAVYEAAVTGHMATLAKLPAPQIANQYAHAARVLQSWGLSVTADWLKLNMPFVTVLIAELGTIAFLHLGLSHRRAPKPVEPEFNDSDLAPLPAETDNVLSFCKAFKAANGRAPSIKEVQSKFPDTPRTTAWRKAQAA